MWLSFKGVLSAYSTKKNKFVGLGSVTQPNKPEDTPELLREIKFYVSHTGPHSSGNGVVEYTAKEGMTWKEFCESEYNVNNFTAYESPDEEYYDYNSEISTYNYSEDDGTSWGGYEEYGWLAPTPAN